MDFCVLSFPHFLAEGFWSGLLALLIGLGWGILGALVFGVTGGVLMERDKDSPSAAVCLVLAALCFPVGVIYSCSSDETATVEETESKRTESEEDTESPRYQNERAHELWSKAKDIHSQLDDELRPRLSEYVEDRENIGVKLRDEFPNEGKMRSIALADAKECIAYLLAYEERISVLEELAYDLETRAKSAERAFQASQDLSSDQAKAIEVALKRAVEIKDSKMVSVDADSEKVSKELEKLISGD